MKIVLIIFALTYIVIGSVANIIVFESARDEVKVGFFEYLKVGLPLILITLVLGL